MGIIVGLKFFGVEDLVLILLNVDVIVVGVFIII